ncbi:MAG TPA: polysaccharide biosynthesis/export family protein [Gemmatimonadales bacterium]|nr:polysaccharide biosynthesis/export family protein [Gemmatimonadales bacterium]
MRPLASTMILLSALALARPMVAQQATHQAERSEQAVLTPGDSIRIQVWRRPEFSGDFVIAPDGSITHPLYRTVRVGGVPFATAEANIRRFLSGFEENPQFVMEPLIRVAISGEVTRPSVFATRPETTVGEAMARAGGATQNGARNRVRVIRFTQSGVQQVFRLDLENSSSTDFSIPVRSGDQIVVDRKKSFTKDILLPTLGVIGSIASVGLLIDRIGRGN